MKRKLTEDGTSTWLQLKEKGRLEAFENSLSVRSNDSSGLLADITRDSIEKLLLTRETTLRLTFKETDLPEIALKLDSEGDMNSFLKILEKFQYPTVYRNKVEESIVSGLAESAPGKCPSPFFSGPPDLSDPAVEDLILKLLHDEEFIRFTEQLENMLSLAFLPHNSNNSFTETENESDKEYEYGAKRNRTQKGEEEGEGDEEEFKEESGDRDPDQDQDMGLFDDATFKFERHL